MIRSKGLLVTFLLLFSALSQQAYYGTGKAEKPCCPNRRAETNIKVNWKKNYICNGDFEDPQLDPNRIWTYFPSIPCWTSTSQIEISKPTPFPEMKSQVVELDAESNG